MERSKPYFKTYWTPILGKGLFALFAGLCGIAAGVAFATGAEKSGVMLVLWIVGAAVFMELSIVIFDIHKLLRDIRDRLIPADDAPSAAEAVRETLASKLRATRQAHAQRKQDAPPRARDTRTMDERMAAARELAAKRRNPDDPGVLNVD